jgi:LysM repeat protein
MLDQFVVPFRGKVISKYGMRRGRMHTGTDIKLNLGDTVVAAYKGVVTRAQTYYGYGRLVVVNHSLGLETYYAHLSSILVKAGDTISTGQIIGFGGRTGRATGTHLHFEIRENGRAYNPELVFDFDNHTIKPDIEGKEMLADLIKKPRVTEKKHVIEMGDTPSEYVIRSGDSLWVIARRFQVTINELCELNNLTTKSILRIGSVLRIY